MICSVLMDWEDSIDFPDNGASALGRPLAAYPLIAAKSSSRIHRRFALTSSQTVKSAALQYGAIVLDPPAALKTIPRDLAMLNSRDAVSKELEKEEETLDLLVILCAQAPAVTVEIIEAGIDAVEKNSSMDFAASVSLVPRTDLWHPNWGIYVIRPSLLAGRDAHPLTRLGPRSFPIKQDGVWPIDYQWQIPALESWLRKQGASDASQGLEPQPQMQKSTKTSPRSVL
ncbi:MAG: glycosyltransferase family protein [Elusimicrobiota bacterium]